jgi:predicted O-linked N-acetylglucosamine transferase (SPINDLY family)
VIVPPTQQPLFDLVFQCLQGGRVGHARQLAGQFLAAAPRNPLALYLLGFIARQAGQLAEAEDLFRRAIAANPAEATYYNDLGDVLHSQGQLDEAIPAFRRAVELHPAFSAAHNNLGNALKALGQFEEALTAYGRALQATPQIAEIHSNYAATLRELGRVEEASAAARRAIALKPNFAMAHNNLGYALLGTGDHDGAMAAFEKALALEPNLAIAHNNRGSVLKELRRDAEATAAFQRAVDADPQYAPAITNLASALHEIGNVAEAIMLDQRALQMPGASPAIHSNYLAILHLQPGATLAGLLEAHRGYEQRYGQPLRASWPRHPHLRDPDRPLRLGFVSPYFTFHPVGFFLVQLLENLDENQFAVIGYEDSSRPDSMAARLKARTRQWHPVKDLTDDALAKRIRDDRIDILFDLEGHNAKNRLLTFARKPAPVQITWLDYVGTTGLSAMDYILADARQIPPEAEPGYSEKVLRMPDDYICFDPPAEAPPIGPLPALANGFVTFASFNALPKITPKCVEIWSRILRKTPSARLRLKNRRVDDPAIVARLRESFSENSVDPARVDFHGWSQRDELLAAYHAVDIALDTLPYNGGLTTCEALWMGVPVVTCPGETFASRHGLAHLSAAGVTETIAHDLDEYVEIAVRLAGDLARLSVLRAGLRERTAASPLCDGPRFARNFSSVVREAWRRWCLSEDTGETTPHPSST